MKNIFTIDTEDWYHANFEDGLFTNDSNVISTVEKNIDRYLELFSENDVKATFFVLGFVVEQHPQMIKKLLLKGMKLLVMGMVTNWSISRRKKNFERMCIRVKA